MVDILLFWPDVFVIKARGDFYAVVELELSLIHKTPVKSANISEISRYHMKVLFTGFGVLGEDQLPRSDPWWEPWWLMVWPNASKECVQQASIAYFRASPFVEAKIFHMDEMDVI